MAPPTPAPPAAPSPTPPVAWLSVTVLSVTLTVPSLKMAPPSPAPPPTPVLAPKPPVASLPENVLSLTVSMPSLQNGAALAWKAAAVAADGATAGLVVRKGAVGDRKGAALVEDSAARACALLVAQHRPVS